MDLVRHQCSQTALLCIQLDGVKYPLVDHLSVKWTADIVRYSQARYARRIQASESSLEIMITGMSSIH